jgi:UDP-glucose 4-epimerase
VTRIARVVEESLQKVTICGGCGFVGSHLAQALAERGHTVRVLCRTSAKGSLARNISGSIQVLTGDCANASDVQQAVIDADTVVNAIGTTVPASANESPRFDLETNVLPALTILDCCVKAGVRHVVLPSSGGTVYGIARYLPIDEDHALNPMGAYGIHKVTIESYLRVYHNLHGINATIMRLANPYGPRQNLGRGQGIISMYCSRVVSGLPLSIWGDGSVVRDYVHIDDVVLAMVMAIERGGGLRVFNVGSGIGTSVSEIVRLLKRVSGQDVAVEYTPGRGADLPANVLDITRIRSELGWTPHISLEAGIMRTLAWYRAQRP